MQKPPKSNKIFNKHTKEFLDTRGKLLCKYIQEIGDIPEILDCNEYRSFVGIYPIKISYKLKTSSRIIKENPKEK